MNKGKIVAVAAVLAPLALSADSGKTQGKSIDAGGMPVCLARVADLQAQLTALQAQLAAANASLNTCNGNLTACNGNLTICSGNLTTCTGNLTTCDSALTSCESQTCTSAAGSQTNPGQSCAALKAAGVSASAVYWLAPGGTAAFQVYCDMGIDGGIGAALVATVGAPNYGNNPYGIMNLAAATADLPMPAAWPNTPNRKLSDAQINALKAQSQYINAYRLSCGTATYPQTRWFRTSCTFHADQTPSGDCTAGASSSNATDWHYNGNNFGYGLDADEYGDGGDKVVYLSPQGNYSTGGCYGIHDGSIGNNNGTLYIE